MNSIPKICFTGGPCGGKSAAIEWLKSKYPNRFLSVPEVASFCVPIGLRRDQDDQKLMLHKIILATQITIQEAVERMSRQLSRIMILDRGTIDCLAYVETPDQLAAPQKASGMLRWYDVVIHMVSLAKAMPHLYAVNSGNYRNEDSDKAREIDGKLGELWSKHPRYVSVNFHEQFDDKMHSILTILTSYGLAP